MSYSRSERTQTSWVSDSYERPVGGARKFPVSDVDNEILDELDLKVISRGRTVLSPSEHEPDSDYQEPNFENSFPESESDKDAVEKPSHSYIALIAMAILASQEQKLVLSDIYHYIMHKYPFFRSQVNNWPNSIRHNLSVNHCFIKTDRSKQGMGHYWAIHPAYYNDFANGDFRRGRVRRRTTKIFIDAYPLYDARVDRISFDQPIAPSIYDSGLSKCRISLKATPRFYAFDKCSWSRSFPHNSSFRSNVSSPYYTAAARQYLTSIDHEGSQVEEESKNKIGISFSIESILSSKPRNGKAKHVFQPSRHNIAQMESYDCEECLCHSRKMFPRHWNTYNLSSEALQQEPHFLCDAR